MPIESLIAEAKRAYTAAGLDCGDALLPPADAAAIAAMGKTLGLALPKELREVYRVHGGQEDFGAGVMGLFGRHRLHTPAEILEHHEMFTDNCLRDPLPAFPPSADEWGY